ncbi:winged helix-turn-helix transcriptional regulator [Streptomyces solisilvae]|uniref:winged helix-turn-helix transcriptional regulator n=1 Tax=Streptomyces malaysiensis TaxID=92644 RepID=UPI0036B9266D
MKEEALKTRSYNDVCGLAQALDNVGERWALLIVRELLFGPRRFTELRLSLEGISQNVLSQRLRELQTASVVVSVKAASSARAHAYELTPIGYSLEPTLTALARWGMLTDPHEGTDLSASAFMLLLKVLYAPQQAAGQRVAQFDLDGETFTVTAGKQDVEITRGHFRDASLTITASIRIATDLLLEGLALSDAIASHRVQIHGDPEAAAALLAQFGVQ